MAINRRRQAVRGLHAVVAVGILIACVVIAQALLGFSAAWLVGAVIAYPVSTIVVRRLLPQPEALTDEERLQLVPWPVWLITATCSVAILHTWTVLSWVWSIAVVAIGASWLLAIELRQRSQARRRLAVKNEAKPQTD